MHTAARITLPSPDDPSLNAPILTARAPHPPLPDLDSSCEYPPEPLTSPYAIALASHGEAWLPKAQKAQECSLYSYIAKCGNGHILGLRVIRCNCRFSPCCRDEKAQESIDRWQKVIDHITNDHRNSKHVLLELKIPVPRSREAAAAAIAQVSRDITSLCDDLAYKAEQAKKINPKAPCFHGESDPYWVNTLGYLGDDLVIRVLTIDRDGIGTATIPTPTWRELWPEARVSVTVGKHLAFRSAFHQMMKPLPLDDPADCAEQEVLFYRMQLLRAHKISLTCTESINITTLAEIAEAEAAEELSVEGTTDNSEIPPKPQPIKAKPSSPCPICGDTHVVRSSRLRVGSPELTAELTRIRESDIYMRPPG